MDVVSGNEIDDAVGDYIISCPDCGSGDVDRFAQLGDNFICQTCDHQWDDDGQRFSEAEMAVEMTIQRFHDMLKLYLPTYPNVRRQMLDAAIKSSSIAA